VKVVTEGMEGIREMSQAATTRREWSGDGTVPVQGDGSQHVVGGGQSECLQEIKSVNVSMHVFEQSFLSSYFLKFYL
jgi:hypothetical protein